MKVSYGAALNAALQAESVTEDDVWSAIAEDMGVDYWEIADGDLAEYL